MLFNTFDFIILFLPITFGGYLVISKYAPSQAWQLAWLMLASLFFYAYWDYCFLPVILISILGNYGFGRVISALPQDAPERAWTLAAALVLNLAALGFYKYANFTVDVVNEIRKGTLEPLAIVLPIGISFFTFTQIAYLVDVYRKHEIERSLIRYTLFVTYFPHLIAGPILHHSEMMPQFHSLRSRLHLPSPMAIGITVFSIWLFKKVIIADGFAGIANPVFAAAAAGNVGTFDAWAGGAAYALQLYFDFSGYCDMAIGLSQLFGIALPYNFDAPYKSRSIIEFWRRWHVTLSRFLRDYLYIPLGGNRRGPHVRNINLFVTMVIGGLWHGAGWTFIVWGALHGAFLLVNHGWTSLRRTLSIGRALGESAVYSILALLLMQACVLIAWVFFRAGSMKEAGRIVASMAGLGGEPAGASAALVTPLAAVLIALFYLVCFAALNVNSMFAGRHLALDTYHLERRWSVLEIRWSPSAAWAVTTALLLLVSLLGILIVGDSTEFLYFQF